MAASLPPLGWWPLAPVGVAVLALAMGGRSWRERLWLGAGLGVGWFGPGLWWVTQFHAVGWVAIVVLETLIVAAVVSAVPPRVVAVGLPAAMVLAEAARGRWPFGGLPLAGIDIGQAGGPLVGVARLGGALALVGVVALAGVGLAAAVRRRPVGAAACLGATALLTGAGGLAFDGKPAGTLEVAAVQGGGPRGLRAVDSDPARVLEAHLEASAGVRPGADLVLWPEDVVDVTRSFEGSVAEGRISSLARSLEATLVVGVVEDVPGRARFRNAAVAFGPDGAVSDRFDKVHRVPFGEYIPYRSLFERLADVSAVPRDALPGRGPGVLDTPAGRLAVAISFEVFYADRARSGVREGGRLLLVPTNASSFTTSQVPTQELAVARLRAVETGRWVVQAAPTGLSGIVDQRGRVRARGPLGDRAVVEGTAGLRTGRTLAVRLGDWPVPTTAALVLAGAWVYSRKPESN